MPFPDAGSFALTTQALHDLGLKGALALVPSWQAGLEQPAPAPLDRMASEGFRGNEVVYACVREIASTAAEVELRVEDGAGRPQPGHGLQRLLQRPNPEQSSFELIEALLTDLLVYGNAFLLKQRGPEGGTGGGIEALWKLRPDRVQIVAGERRLVAGYVHRVGDRETRLAAESVIHLRLPDPANDLWGLSPVRAAARQIDTDSEASRFVEAFFRNAAVPFGIIKLKRALRGGEPEASRIGRRWSERFRGLFGRFQVGVLDADAEFQRIGLTQEEMAFPELRAQTEARICAAFRVPPVLVGVKVGLDRSTFSNMAEARRFFWENTMLSLYRRLAEKLNAELTPEYGRGPRGCAWPSTSARWRRCANRARASSGRRWRACGPGALTVNDARRRLGLEPIDDGDRFVGGAATGGARLASWAGPDGGAVATLGRAARAGGGLVSGRPDQRLRRRLRRARRAGRRPRPWRLPGHAARPRTAAAAALAARDGGAAGARRGGRARTGAGLWFEAALAPTRRAADALALIERGSLRECSIGFVPRRVRFEHRDGRTLRRIADAGPGRDQPGDAGRQPRRARDGARWAPAGATGGAAARPGPPRCAGGSMSHCRRRPPERPHPPSERSQSTVKESQCPPVTTCASARARR